MASTALETYIPTPWPVVFTDDKVVEQLGEPNVEYEGLAELYYGDLGIPTDVLPRIELKPIPRALSNLYQDFYGYHVVFSESVVIDPIKSLKPSSPKNLTQILLHESKHLADDILHPVRSATQHAAKLAVVGLGTAISYKAFANGTLPDAGQYYADTFGGGGRFDDLNRIGGRLIPSMLLGGTFFPTVYYRVDPYEKRARRLEKNAELVQKYKDVITFPDA